MSALVNLIFIQNVEILSIFDLNDDGNIVIDKEGTAIKDRTCIAGRSIQFYATSISCSDKGKLKILYKSNGTSCVDYINPHYGDLFLPTNKDLTKFSEIVVNLGKKSLPKKKYRDHE